MKKIDLSHLQKYLNTAPTHAHQEEVFKAIRSMDSHTAYTLLAGCVAPLLFSPSNSPKKLNSMELSPSTIDLNTLSRASIPFDLVEKLEENTKELLYDIYDISDNFQKIREFVKSLGVDLNNIYQWDKLKKSKIYKECIEKIKEKIERLGNGIKLLRDLRDRLGNQRGLSGGVKNLVQDSLMKLTQALSRFKTIFSDTYELRNEIYKEFWSINSARESINETSKFIAELKNTLLEEVTNRVKEEIKEKTKDLKDKITGLEEEKKTLEDKITAKDGNITDLKKKLKEINDRLTKLEKERDDKIDLLTKTLKELKDKMGNRDFDDLQGKVKDLKKELEGLEDLKGKNWKELKEKLDKLDKLTGKDRDLDKGVGDLAKQIKDLRDEIAKMKKEGIDWKNTRDEVAALKDALDKLGNIDREGIKNLQKQLRELQDKLGDAANDPKKIKEINDKIKEIRDKIKAEKDKIQKEIDELEKKERELELKKKEEEDKLKEIKDKKILEKRKKELEDLNKELEKIRKERITKIGKPEESIEQQYVRMIVVFITILYTQVEKVLKRQGETMKQIAKLQDKWNEIQNDLNELFGHSKVTLQWIRDLQKGEGKLVFPSNWEKIKKIPLRLLQRLDEMEDLLEKTWKNIPASHRNLIDTMKKLCQNLRKDMPTGKELEGLDITDNSDYLEALEKERIAESKWKKLGQEAADAYNKITREDWILKDLGHKTFNILNWTSLVKMKDEAEKKWQEARNKRRSLDRGKSIDFKGKQELLGLLKIMGDSDQTEFKKYMDNIAKGITAMTSISNAVQQELNINTQYYNSLLAFQKSGMDSLNRNAQSAIRNIRS